MASGASLSFSDPCELSAGKRCAWGFVIYANGGFDVQTALGSVRYVWPRPVAGPTFGTLRVLPSHFGNGVRVIPFVPSVS